MLCGQVYADFESEVLDLVNVERAAEGLTPLSYDARLAAAARSHSEDMGLQNYFSHTSLDGRTVSDRITDAGSGSSGGGGGGGGCFIGTLGENFKWWRF
jgi:uncharacterized protein YkwD